MAERLLSIPLRAIPGTGPLRLHIRVPSERLFAVRGATFSQWDLVADAWVIRGTLQTTEGEVQAREGELNNRLLLHDRLVSYAYTYATETLAVIATPARIRLEWQYAPARGPAVAFQVYKQSGVGTAFLRYATVTPVEDQPKTYRAVDTELVPGVTYAYYVTAVTVDGHESVASDTVTIEVPREVQPPLNMAAQFIGAS
jgi:hypothetical protein